MDLIAPDENFQVVHRKTLPKAAYLSKSIEVPKPKTEEKKARSEIFSGSMSSSVKGLKQVDATETKTMDMLMQAGYKARYNLHTNTQTTSKPGYFSSFVKYFVTDKVEIK